MKILHTADWHLGRLLYGRRRYVESEAFLTWLVDTLRQESIDVLIVAGDVFDTTTPGNRAVEQYFSFLGRLRETPCRHVVVISGNHDSPTHLDAPAALLRQLNVHVIGSALPDAASEVISLQDRSGQPELIVAAVPFLRDQDVRGSAAGESMDDKDRQLVEGIRAHYQRAANQAVQLQAACDSPVPIVATGHLFVQGRRTSSRSATSPVPEREHPEEEDFTGDGVRELYVGSLGQVEPSIFPAEFDYVALGHLHIPHAVSGAAHIRYSGSPLPMGFSEAAHVKSVAIVEFSGRELASMTTVPVPVFQQLQRLEGTWGTVQSELQRLVDGGSSVWVEVICTDEEIIVDLERKIHAITDDSAVTVLKMMNRRAIAAALSAVTPGEDLAELTPADVFSRFLAISEIPAAQHAALQRIYDEIVLGIATSDVNAELTDEAA
ncbi:MAG: exonuclease SbcCD subunit D C-terminal domain-containing protein [Planctomycetaceae bacterium]|nr:exonuclease SbcCD subunit D C-terminal domain-containing protein [Planctomycetaceae bacterium]